MSKTTKRTYTKRAPAKRTYAPRRAPVTRARKPRAPRQAAQSDSSGWLGPLLGTAGSALGTMIGGPAGTALGGAAGNILGQGIKYVTGFGDYDVHDNVLLKEAVTGAPAPIINKDRHGGTVIRHREFLGDITTSQQAGAFKLQSFAINPANQYTFPWLSQIASNYEQYSLEGVIFEYRSMSGDALNSTNTALGSVVMATNYNAGAPLFSQKVEMENYEFGVSCKPSQGMMHPIECEPRRTSISELYTRAGAVPVGQDIRLYDWGNFQIATTGFQAASVNIGELWVSYQVCLLKPKMYTSLGSFNDLYALRSPTYTLIFPLGNPLNQPAFNTLGAYITYNVANIGVINLPFNNVKQSYMARITWVGTTNAALVYPAISLNNADYGTFQPLEYGPGAGISSNIATMEFCFITSGNGLPVSVSLNGTSMSMPTVATNCAIRIYQIANEAINVVF